MKLPWLMIVLFLFSLLTATYFSRRDRRTLSPAAKKPASPGWLPLPHALLLSPHPSFSSRRHSFTYRLFPYLFIQTPSSC
jgi:hypothetical protein